MLTVTESESKSRGIFSFLTTNTFSPHMPSNSALETHPDYKQYHNNSESQSQLDWHILCHFLPANVKGFPRTGKNWSRRYPVPAETRRFSLCNLIPGDLYSVPWVQKQVEAPTKQDCFRCWSQISKQNSDHPLSHRRCCTLHTLGQKQKLSIETGDKTIKPLSYYCIKWRKIKEYNNTWMTYFPWHRHEDDTDTGRSGISALPLFCRPYCAKVETGVVNRNFILKPKKRKKCHLCGYP